MALGLPAHFKQNRQFDLQQDELLSIVKSAFENLGWPYQAADDEFIASLHNCPMTFGEEFKAKLLPNGEIHVESKCVTGGMYGMPQIFDFDANKKDVEAFFAEIDRIMGETTLDNKPEVQNDNGSSVSV